MQNPPDIDPRYAKYLTSIKFALLNLALDKSDECESACANAQTLAREYNDWNRDNVIHASLVILGLLSLKKNKMDDAVKYMIQSVKIDGSPQLNSFGPNLCLQEKILRLGVTKPVIQSLEDCARFWEMGHDSIEKWKSEIVSGNIPNFGGNLVFHLAT